MAMSAVDVGGDEIEDAVLQKLGIGFYQLWVISRDDDIVATAITQVEQRSARKVMALRYLAGEGLEGWYRQGLDKMEQFARWSDCDTMEFSGKPGFGALAARIGFTEAHTTYRRSVDG